METTVRLPVEGPADQLVAASQLLRAGALAFTEGNPWRARRVRDEVRGLLAQVEGRSDSLLTEWSPKAGAADLMISRWTEGMARSADQLAALAESRPTSARPSETVRSAFQAEADAVAVLLAALETGDSPPGGVDAALLHVRRCRQEALAASMERPLPRSFAMAMLTAAAASRLEEGAEAAAEALLGLGHVEATA